MLALIVNSPRHGVAPARDPGRGANQSAAFLFVLDDLTTAGRLPLCEREITVVVSPRFDQSLDVADAVSLLQSWNERSSGRGFSWEIQWAGRRGASHRIALRLVG